MAPNKPSKQKPSEQELSGLLLITKKLGDANVVLGEKVSGAFGKYAAALTAVTSLYGRLIASNEAFRKSVIQTQTSIASQSRVFTQWGDEITDVGEKIQATEGLVRNALLKLEKETRELTGVTSAQTTEAFNIVLSEGGAILQNQLGEYEDSIEASVAITKGLVAALGTLGMPLQQARQEFRAFVQGDLRNPDAQIIKQLGIDEASFRKAEREGSLAEFIVKSFEPATEANKLASRSIEGALSNIQDVTEVAGRAAGKKLTDGFVNALIEIQDYLFANEDGIYDWAEQVGKDLGEIFDNLSTIVGPLVGALADGFGDFGEYLQFVISGVSQFTDLLAKAVESAKALEGLEFAGFKLGVDKNETSALEGLTTGLLKNAREGFGRLTGGAERAENAITAFDEALLTQGAGLRRLKEAREEALAVGDTEKAKQYAQLIDAERNNIARLTDELGNIEPVTVEQEGAIDALRARLKSMGESVDEAVGPVGLLGRALQEFADPAEEFAMRSEASEKAISNILANGAKNTDELTAKISQFSGEVQTLWEIGGIGADAAIEKLRQYADLAVVTPEQRFELEQQILSILEQQQAIRENELSLQKAIIGLQEVKGDITPEQAQLNQLLVDREIQLEAIATLEQKLEVAKGLRNNAKQAEALALQLEQAKVQLQTLDAQADSLEIASILADAERQAQRLTSQIDLLQARLGRDIRKGAKGLFDTQADLSRALTDAEIDANKQAIEVLKERIGAQQQAISLAQGENRKKLELELNGLLQTMEQRLGEAAALQAQLTTNAIAGIDERLGIEAKANKLRFTQEDIALAQQKANLANYVDAYNLAQLQLSGIQADQTLERAKVEEDAAGRRLAQLKQLEVPTDQQARLQLIEQIRVAEQDLANAQLGRIEAIRGLNAQVLNERLSAIDAEKRALADMTSLYDRGVALESQRAQMQQRAVALDLQAAQQRLQVLNAQANLSQTVLGIEARRIDQAKSLTAELRTNLTLGARERAIIRERLQDLGISGTLDADFAKKKLALLEKQIAQEKDASAKKFAAEASIIQLQGVQASLQAKMQTMQAKADVKRQEMQLKQLELKRAETELIADPEERARQLAIIDQEVGLQTEAVDIAKENVGLAEQGEAAAVAGSGAQLEALSLRRKAEVKRENEGFGERRFAAQRELARAQDRPFGEQSPFGALRAPRLNIEDALRGSGVDSADANRALSGRAGNVTNITNNFNAPLANPTLARSLGL